MAYLHTFHTWHISTSNDGYRRNFTIDGRLCGQVLDQTSESAITESAALMIHSALKPFVMEDDPAGFGLNGPGLDYGAVCFLPGLRKTKFPIGLMMIWDYTDYSDYSTQYIGDDHHPLVV